MQNESQNQFRYSGEQKFGRSTADVIKFAVGIILVAGIIAFFYTYSSSNSDEQAVSDKMIIGELKKKNDEYALLIEDKARVQKKLEDNIAELKEIVAKRDGQIETKGVQIDSKEGSIEHFRRENVELKDDKHKLHDLISSRDKEILVLNERIKEQNALLKSTQEQIKESTNAQKEKESELKNLQSESKLMTEKLAIVQTENKELQTQVNQLMTQLTDAKTQLNQSKIDLNDSKTELKILKEIKPTEVNKPQEDHGSNALKIVAIVSVIVMFIVFVIYMLQN